MASFLTYVYVYSAFDRDSFCKPLRPSWGEGMLALRQARGWFVKWSAGPKRERATPRNDPWWALSSSDRLCRQYLSPGLSQSLPAFDHCLSRFMPGVALHRPAQTYTEHVARFSQGTTNPARGSTATYRRSVELTKRKGLRHPAV